MADMATKEPAGAVTDGVRLLLRLEGLALGIAAVVVYSRLGVSWWLFAVLILAPDLSFLGYLVGPRPGACAYNILHTSVLPIAVGLAGLLVGSTMTLAIAAIWLAHIGFDRALGYGLKYTDGFNVTHLGRIGRTSASGH